MMAKETKENSIKTFLKDYVLAYNSITLIVLLIAGIYSTGFNIILPYLLKNMLDHAVSKNISAFTHNTLLFVILWLVSFPIMYISAFAGKKLKLNVKMRLRKELLKKIHVIPYKDAISKTQGAYLQVISDDVDKIEPLIIEAYLYLFLQILMAIGSLYFMLKINVLLTTISILPVPLYFYLLMAYQKKAGAFTQERQNAYQKVIEFLDESISNTYLVRNFGVLWNVLNAFKDIYESYIRRYLGLFKLNYWYNNILNYLLSMSVQLAVIIVGAVLVLHGKFTAGGVIAFMMYVNYIKAPLQYILTFGTTVEPAKVSLSRIYDILNKNDAYIVKKHSTLPKIEYKSPAIFIRNLSFSYDKGTKVIKGLNLRVEAGEWLCIVGESGIGKTTFLNLLLKHFPVGDGEIFIFSRDINQISIGKLNMLITLIEQEPIFFGNMSVYENLTLGKDIQLSRIVELSRAIGMEGLMNKLSESKKVLMKNSGLSGGEKKRLALLRGILKDAPIVIIDEPTAFLDRENIESILNGLRRVLEGKTVLMTTHDELVKKICDRSIDIK